MSELLGLPPGVWLFWCSCQAPETSLKWGLPEVRFHTTLEPEYRRSLEAHLEKL